MSDIYENTENQVITKHIVISSSSNFLIILSNCFVPGLKNQLYTTIKIYLITLG